jgi:hypothetical protein
LAAGAWGCWPVSGRPWASGAAALGEAGVGTGVEVRTADGGEVEDRGLWVAGALVTGGCVLT